MLFVNDFAVKMLPKSSAEEFSNVFKYKKAVMYLTEEICKLDKLF